MRSSGGFRRSAAQFAAHGEGGAAPAPTTPLRQSAGPPATCDEDRNVAPGSLASSDATIVVANLEDFWLERRRQNLPGTEAADRNWKRPFERSFDEFSRDDAIHRLVAILAGSSPVVSPNEVARASAVGAP